MTLSKNHKTVDLDTHLFPLLDSSRNLDGQLNHQKSYWSLFSVELQSPMKKKKINYILKDISVSVSSVRRDVKFNTDLHRTFCECTAIDERFFYCCGDVFISVSKLLLINPESDAKFASRVSIREEGRVL